MLDSFQNKKKIVIIISGLDFSFGIKWSAEFLDKNKFEQIYIFINNHEPALFNQFKNLGIRCYFIPYFGKKNSINVFYKIIKILRIEKPKIVHTHLFEANILGLLAARILKIPNRIYTRHHSTLHHQYFPRMVKYDRFINSISTKIIAISKNVASILIEREKVPAEKVVLINHGFDLSSFSNPNQVVVENLKEKLVLNDRYPVIGVISRFTYWKGIPYIIEAFSQLLKEYPNAKLVLANAKGDYSDEIFSILSKLPKNSWVDIAFEKDVFALYALFDIFVHVPIDAEAEAFGQIYIESLASEVPSIFTMSGIAREFIVDNFNALVVPFKNDMAILNAILLLLNDDNLRLKLVKQGKMDVNRLFGLDIMKVALEKIYNE